MRLAQGQRTVRCSTGDRTPQSSRHGTRRLNCATGRCGKTRTRRVLVRCSRGCRTGRRKPGIRDHAAAAGSLGSTAPSSTSSHMCQAQSCCQRRPHSDEIPKQSSRRSPRLLARCTWRLRCSVRCTARTTRLASCIPVPLRRSRSSLPVPPVPVPQSERLRLRAAGLTQCCTRLRTTRSAVERQHICRSCLAEDPCTHQTCRTGPSTACTRLG